MILDMTYGKEILLPKVSEITVIRYFEEIIIRNEERISSAVAESNVISKTHFLV
jgi:hypothetical protein